MDIKFHHHNFRIVLIYMGNMEIECGWVVICMDNIIYRILGRIILRKTFSVIKAVEMIEKCEKLE